MFSRYKSAKGRQLIFDSYGRLLEMWGIDKVESDIETRFGKTHVITAGSRENPPLLLFHGVGDNSALMWIYNSKELAKHFYIMAVDAIGGSGKSEPEEQYFKGFDQTLWIDDVLSELNVDKINIAGVSYGSYLTQLYAIERPERVDKIVCMAGAIAVEDLKSNGMRMLLTFLPEALFPSEKNAKKLMNKLCGSNSKVFTENTDLMQHWLYLLKYFNNRSMMYHKLKRFSKKQIVGIREKTFVLLGDCDRLAYHPKVIKSLEDNRIKYKIIKDTGHGINHEQAELINNEIINFLNSHV